MVEICSMEVSTNIHHVCTQKHRLEARAPEESSVAIHTQPEQIILRCLLSLVRVVTCPLLTSPKHRWNMSKKYLKRMFNLPQSGTFTIPAFPCGWGLTLACQVPGFRYRCYSFSLHSLNPWRFAPIYSIKCLNVLTVIQSGASSHLRLSSTFVSQPCLKFAVLARTRPAHSF